MASIEMHKGGLGAALHSAATGLRTAERVGGYVLSEDGEIAPGRAMGRLIGASFVLAGLGLLALPMDAGTIGKAVIGVGLVVGGGIIAARAGKTPRLELDVDLERRMLRKRELRPEGSTRLLAQWSFAEITGLEVKGQGGRAALVLESGTRRGAVLHGAPEALQGAARRIGADLLRAREAL